MIYARRILQVVLKIEEIALIVGILGIASLMVLNVILRSFFQFSLSYGEEVCQFLVIIVTFLGMSYATSQARHIRMSALFDLLPVEGQRQLMAVIGGVTALVMYTLCYYGILYCLKVAELGSVSSVLRVPLHYVYAAVPLGFFLAGTRYLFIAIKNASVKDQVYVSFNHRHRYDED